MLLMYDFIVHLGDIAGSDFGLEQDVATYAVILKLAGLVLRCRQNM